MAARAKLSLKKKLLFTAAMVAAVVFGLELLMRLCGYGPLAPAEEPSDAMPEDPRPPDAFEYFALCDRELGFRNRARGRYHSWKIRGDPLATTDQFGYRNTFGWDDTGSSPIIVFLGDSTVFCSEVSDDETAPSEVAKLLRRKHDVRVLNAAVRGYGTLQAKRMLIQCLDRFSQIKVAVYTHCGNDVEENLLPDMRYPAKVPFMARDARTGPFREVEVSEPAVGWGESFYGWEPPESNWRTPQKVCQWLDARSAVCHYCFLGLQRLVGRPPREDPEALNAWARRNGGFEALRQLLLEMDRLCRDRGVVFLATSFYSGSDASTPNEFAELCDAAGIRCVSLVEHFTGKPSSYVARRVDGRCDAHYGPLGTQTYAQALAPALDHILRSEVP